VLGLVLAQGLDELMDCKLARKKVPELVTLKGTVKEVV
jgi:hypothetical protein